MADNSNRSAPSSGESIRSIDRSGTGPKTQVVQIDIAGSGATETLATATAASTAPVAATPALVVALSPNMSTVAGALTKVRAGTPGAADVGVSVLYEALTVPAAVTTAQFHRPQMDAATGGVWTHPVQPSFRIEVDSAGLTTATTAYVTGDHAGTVNTFANAARVTGWGGVITGAALLDKSLKVSTIPVELWLFQATMASAGADNAALTFSDADMVNFVGIIYFDTGGWKATALNAINSQQNLSLGYTCAATSLFGYYVLRGVPASTFFSATTDLRVSLQLLRD